jgi:hypothetical protein
MVWSEVLFYMHCMATILLQHCMGSLSFLLVVVLYYTKAMSECVSRVRTKNVLVLVLVSADV